MSVHLQVNIDCLSSHQQEHHHPHCTDQYPIKKNLSFKVRVNVTALSLTECIKTICLLGGSRVAHLSLCITRMASSFFFFVFFDHLVLHLPLTHSATTHQFSLFNPPTKSFLFSSFSGEHQQTVLGLSTGHQLRNLRLHHRLTVWLLWETI